MANGILKGLAVAAGTGLAMGLTAGRVRVRAIPPSRTPAPPPPPQSNPSAHIPVSDPDSEFLDIEPLLDRLERLEARVESMGRQPGLPESVSPPAHKDLAAAIADLELRVEQNTRELALLREHVTAAEQRMAESVTVVRRRVEETREEMPAVVEKQVTARIEDLRTRFSREMEQAHQRTLETFERAIDEKITSRIGSLEKALTDQAGSIESLSARTAETDRNLQRLVTAIEKLCERTQLYSPAPGQQPAERPVPSAFETQMDEAMARVPVTPLLRSREPAADALVPAPAFTTAEGEPKRRFLFRNLIVAGFSLIAARFLR